MEFKIGDTIKIIRPKQEGERFNKINIKGIKNINIKGKGFIIKENDIIIIQYIMNNLQLNLKCKTCLLTEKNIF
jgi:hypothetical protein